MACECARVHVRVCIELNSGLRPVFFTAKNCMGASSHPLTWRTWNEEWGDKERGREGQRETGKCRGRRERQKTLCLSTDRLLFGCVCMCMWGWSPAENSTIVGQYERRFTEMLSLCSIFGSAGPQNTEDTLHVKHPPLFRYRSDRAASLALCCAQRPLKEGSLFACSFSRLFPLGFGELFLCSLEGLLG